MSFRRIVIGLDFLSPSLAAARFAVRKLRALEFVFVHVLPEHATSKSDPLVRARDAQSRLRQIAHALGVAEPDFDVVSGRVADELCLIAEDVEADLICVGGSQGNAGRGIQAARAIVERSTVSTLIVPTRAAIGPVYAVWSGSNGTAVLRAADDIAREWGEDLNALCFLDEAQWCASDPDGIEQRQLAHILKQADVAGVETVSVDVRRDTSEVGDSIVAFTRPYLGGLLVCDDEVARMVLERDFVSDPKCDSPRRLLDVLTLLVVAAPSALSDTRTVETPRETRTTIHDGSS